MIDKTILVATVVMNAGVGVATRISPLSIHSPELHRTLHTIGRAGAQIAASSTTALPLLPTELESLTVSGGDIDGSTQLPFGFHLSPQGRAVACMASAMALHYLGYSLARPSTLSLFTSKSIGYGTSSSAYPLAMAFVSPMSLLLLMGYASQLEGFGPRVALKVTTQACAAVLLLATGLIKYLSSDANLTGTKLSCLKLIVGVLFIFRESYVQLLTSQHWSFMVSVLDPRQSATWFAPISGLTSVLSAGAGLVVGDLIRRVGLTGVLGLSGVALLGSIALAERGYTISDEYGFNPAKEQPTQTTTKTNTDNKPKKKQGRIQKAKDLFTRVPTLGRLFSEILACQGLSTLLNVCFVSKLSSAIPGDDERAGWMGKFFALVNIVSGVLQFGFLPPLMKLIDPAWLWRAMPTLMVGLTCFQSFQADPSLYLVSGTFLLMKTMEFSARRMLDEMVYVPLDYESRYMGKEIIGVFGYRFGKSGMSLALSGLTWAFGKNHFGLQELSRFTTVAAGLWFVTALRLSNLVPTRDEADATYKLNKMK